MRTQEANSKEIALVVGSDARVPANSFGFTVKKATLASRNQASSTYQIRVGCEARRPDKHLHRGAFGKVSVKSELDLRVGFNEHRIKDEVAVS